MVETASVSIQRAARGQGRSGGAVLLVEKSVYENRLVPVRHQLDKTFHIPKGHQKNAIDNVILRGPFDPQFD